MNQDKLVVKINGEEKACDIYFSLICRETNKGYIAYTDHTKNENDEEVIYVSSYDPAMGTEVLGEINTPEEWDLINNIIEKIKNLK